ncbi:MAG TPA: multiheme c-type cytochrome [Novimethylophilus sp.]|uniref:multiheme c-type cytochrome n=1 Tax=Novimethylophilus sp. TaxID=2137426 RepID=UPI002F3F0CAC
MALSVFVVVLGGCGKREASPLPATLSTSSAHQDAAVETFLKKHWARPLAAQGAVPAHYSALEASLAPADCGSCHAEQYRDWQTALHAHAMGPGIMGQLVNMAPDARAEHQDCIRCHAPLFEQADSLSAALADVSHASPNPSKSPALHEQGLICAACHVRAHERFGPPRRDGSAPNTAQRTAMPHNGFAASTAFQDSRFCAACHQFQPGDFALNSKLLENTYEEWKASRHAREGRSCQSCHMPERRHLWRGVHDPDMVRAAIQFVPEGGQIIGGAVHAALTVRNAGAGHYFPTYVTPKAIVEIEQIASDGHALPDTRVERVIQRQVPLDISREIADTRLPPDGELRLDYVRPLQRAAVALVFRLRVEPDDFYAGFYRSLLTGDLAGRGQQMIRAALKRAESSGFVAFETRQSLPQQ